MLLQMAANGPQTAYHPLVGLSNATWLAQPGSGRAGFLESCCCRWPTRSSFVLDGCEPYRATIGDACGVKDLEVLKHRVGEVNATAPSFRSSSSTCIRL